MPGSSSRAERILRVVAALDRGDVQTQLARVLGDFETRHWQVRDVFLRRYAEIAAQLPTAAAGLSSEARQLVGAYFCHEYSHAAAAVMNPSVSLHPDQSGMGPGARRIVLSLRTVGEGHISSIAFREGILGPGPELELAPEPPFATAASLVAAGTDAEGVAAVERHPDSTLSGTVLFPVAAHQSNGLEDLRLLGFTHAEGGQEVLGTYTAFDGREVRSELLRTRDFRRFDLVPLAGAAAANKGMALFPRAVAGRFWALGRQDGESLFVIGSDDLLRWDGGQSLLSPAYDWDTVQIGNCGAPIELPEGWLVLTHGVGAMRKYSIGACLLDRDDPTRVLARTPEPILSAADADREGYVPNVVYTCGALLHGEHIFMPYGVADSSVGFAFVPVRELLAAMV